MKPYSTINFDVIFSNNLHISLSQKTSLRKSKIYEHLYKPISNYEGLNHNNELLCRYYLILFQEKGHFRFILTCKACLYCFSEEVLVP